MCAINPKHKKRFIVDVYTSQDMTKEMFEGSVRHIMLDQELSLNSIYGQFRFHVKETEQEAE